MERDAHRLCAGARFPGVGIARRVSRDAVVILVALLSGCFGGVRYVSNGALLARTAGDVGLALPPSRYAVVRAEVREDAVLIHYRGIEHHGDQAWVWRFSPKSSEQRPEQLRNVEELVPVLARYRKEFSASPVRSSARDGFELRYITYEFDSPVRGSDGSPLPGRGVFAIVETSDDGEPVVYYVNLDNWGDRDSVDVDALDEFLAAIASRG